MQPYNEPTTDPKSGINVKASTNEILSQARFLDVCEVLDTEIEDADEISKIQSQRDWDKYIEKTYYH